MKPTAYPFEAITGQPSLKLCLMLCAVDWRLSVLLRGDKGSGKSTAARALAGVLPEDAPFVNVPIGVTEDRLLGSLDLQAALDGRLALRRGLIDEAHQGVLYIDEVNLLAGHLADALLDVSATGLYVLERDGISHSRACHFCMLGSMNIEEGRLRPQLLDRFALCLDVHAPAEPELRSAILFQRLRFDEDPTAFVESYKTQNRQTAEVIAAARAMLPEVHTGEEMLQQISREVTAAGVRSLRADLAALRASRAKAALEGRMQVTAEDITAVMPFVLRHRATNPPPQPRDRPQPQQDDSQPSEPEPPSGPQTEERVFEPEPMAVPRLVTRFRAEGQRGSAAQAANGAGRPAPHAPDAAGIDIARSLVESARQTGTARLREETLVPRRVQPSAGARYLFVVDASGSQAARGRMKAVKGAALGILESSARPEDEVSIIAFRGASASVLLPPARSPELVRQRLELLPTGGRTPLAHALATACDLLTPHTLLILLSDGQANVSLAGGDPWEEALAQAARIHCPALVIDTSTNERQRERITALSEAMRATLCPVADLESTPLLHLLQERA